MHKSLTTIISFISLLVLVIIQVYIIRNYYTVKSKNFDMIYSRAVLNTIEQIDYDNPFDPLDNALNKMAYKYLWDYSEDTAVFLNAPLQNEILDRFDSVLNEYDTNSVKIKQYTKKNKLDTLFKSHYIINELAFIDFNDRIQVYKRIKDKSKDGKAKGLYIKSYYNEGSYYAIQYDYYIDFTKKHKVIFSEMRGLLLFTVLTITMVIFAFAYTLYTLQKQKKLTELKGDFIDSISHEFKTPISTISVAVSSLKEQSIRNNTKKYTEICMVLEKQNLFLSKMIDNVINVSLWDRKNVQFNKKSVLVKQFVHETITSYMNEVSEKKMQITEKYALSDDYTYMLDPVQFTRVIYNLLSNSEKYCDKKPIIGVRIWLEKHLGIEIQDNGNGIIKEEQEQIFNKFYRADNPRNVKGLGLGLYIVRKIIETHNGTISLSSTPGSGTTITILLPI